MNSPSGALMHLAAIGQHHIYFANKKPLFSSAYHSLKFIDNKLTIERDGDTCVPLYIKSDEEVKNIDVEIANQVINKIPLEFCNKIYGHETKKDDYFLYKIPWELMFKNDLYLINLCDTNVNISIESEHTCNADLYLKYTYLDSPERKKLYEGNPSYVIKTFQWENHDIGPNVNISPNWGWNRLRFEGVTKGFFVENIDITKINSISLRFNGQTRFYYNRSMIDLFVKKFGNDIIYIPLDDDTNTFDDFEFNSSINLSRIDEVTIKFDSEINQKIKILCLSANCLYYSNGIAKLWLPYNIPMTLMKVIEKFIKKVLAGENLCLIEREEILEGEHYMNCLTCRKNYRAENLKIWLQNNNKCPHCRTKWRDYNIYVNETDE